MKRSMTQSNQTSNKASTTPSQGKKQKTSHTPSPSLSTPKTKPSLTFSHGDFSPGKLDSGPGLKWHDLSNKSFPGGKGVEEYRKETGLEPLKTKQNWGDSSHPLPQGTMFRSRRGSISGFVELPGGDVKSWRLHSLPTSEALRDTTVKNSSDFSNVFSTSANRLSTHAVNTRGTEQPVNTILSDVTKIHFNPGSQRFETLEPTFAMGVSGQGLHSSHSHQERQTLYKPSIEVAQSDGKKGTPSMTYHSEPMAMTLHNRQRSTSIDQDSGLVGMFASFPNQVCFNCGRMFEEKSGEHSVFSGTPGVPFGGQKPGDKFVQDTGSTVFRATPMSELKTDSSQQQELAKLYEHHHH